MLLADVLEFYNRNGLSWGGVDLFALGRAGSILRVGELAAILRVARNNGVPVFGQIVIIWPSTDPNSDVGSIIKERFAEFLGELAEKPVSQAEVDAAFDIVRVVPPKALEGKTLLELIREASPSTAFIVGHAALYRAEDAEVKAIDALALDELWVPHLHTLMEQAGAVAESSQCYIVLDAGETLPDRQEVRELLLSVKHSAVASADVATGEATPSTVSAATLQRWRQLAVSGDLGRALAEVDKAEVLSHRERALVRVQLLGAAGLTNQVRDTLQGDPTLTEDLHPETALHVARLAERVDADEVAAGLLSSAVPRLRMREHLELALEIADRLGDAALLRTAEARTGALYPSSPALRRFRADMLIEEGRYRAAFQLIQAGHREADVPLADFYAFLADQLEGERAIDPVTFMRIVRERFPDRMDQARLAYARKLEDEGQRYDALALILGAATPEHRLARHWALTVLAVVQRGRLVGDPAIDATTVAQAIDSVIDSLAHRPTDAVLRVRLLRTLSPQILGTTGTAIMASLTLSAATQPVTMLERQPFRLRVQPCSEDELRVILNRGAEWLSEQGVFIPGSRIVPPELLGVSPDEALAGFARMASFMARRVSDESDRRGLELCLALATAIAPLSSEPDQDLEILGVVGAALVHAGQMQFARDLVEQAMMLAGNDPRRARRAWLAYADIYARLGNLPEALIGIACALSAHDERTWDEVWFESTLISVVLRRRTVTYAPK